MWKILRERILRTSRAAGAEVILGHEGRHIVHIVCLRVKKSKLQIESQWSGGLTAFDKIPPACPVFISFNGKGVFCRKVSSDSAQSNIADSFFPESNPNEFYYNAHDDNNFSTVTIARKSIIDEIVQQVLEKKQSIINISIGFQPLFLLLPYINGMNNEIRCTTYLISVKNKNIADFEASFLSDEMGDKEFTFSEQYVPDKRAIALSCAVSSLVEDLSQPPTLLSEPVLMMRKEFSNFLLFRFWGWTLLIGVLFILLLNFLFYSIYSQKLSDQEATRLFSVTNVAALGSIEKDIEHKEHFLQNAGWISDSKTSYFADRIASLLPSDIIFTSMLLNPLQKSNGSLTQAIFKLNCIEISGECSNTVFLNQFINNLKNISGVKKVTVLNYQYDNKKEGGSFIMEILVN